MRNRTRDGDAAIKPRVFDASVDVVVRVEVRNPDVIERVTGDGGGEWRSRFYALSTAEDVVEHLAFNFVRNGVVDVSRLDGWADCEAGDVDFVIEDVTTMAAEDPNARSAGAGCEGST